MSLWPREKKEETENKRRGGEMWKKEKRGRRKRDC